ncbi:MAG: sigma 54-interacting transcriptional regulator [Sedimentibacter sp.]
MNITNHTILIIDNDYFRTHNLKISLQTYGYKVKTVQGMNQAICYLKSNIVHVLISNYDTDEIASTKLIKDSLVIDPSLAIIFISKHLDVRTAVVLIKSGAYSCFDDSFKTEELLSTIGKAIEKKTVIKEGNCSTYKFKRTNYCDDIVFESEKMKLIVSMIDRIAQSNATVLLLGESGVGKEVIAKMIHNKSNRKNNRTAIGHPSLLQISPITICSCPFFLSLL